MRDASGEQTPRRRKGALMIRRFELLGLLVGLGLLAAAPGCAANEGEEEPSAETSSELVSTNGFQKGVAPSASYAGVTDTTLREAAPTTTYGSGTSLSADFDDPAGSRKRTNTLVRFDIASIPRGSKVSA